MAGSKIYSPQLPALTVRLTIGSASETFYSLSGLELSPSKPITTNLPMPPEDNYALEVDVHAVKQMLDAKTPFLLIDCREAGEVATCKIDGSIHIPMQQIPARIAEIEPHKGTPIVVHCHHGGRSMRVTQWLRQQGFQSAQNMAGGIDDWSQRIDPAVPRY